jgi:hypothetical protein
MIGNSCVSIKILCGVDLFFLLFDIGDIAAAMTDDVLFCIPFVMVDMKDGDDADADGVETVVVVALLAGGVGGDDDMVLRSSLSPPSKQNLVLVPYICWLRCCVFISLS